MGRKSGSHKICTRGLTCVFSHFRLGLAEERAIGLTKQMSADECMTILKVSGE